MKFAVIPIALLSMLSPVSAFGQPLQKTEKTEAIFGEPASGLSLLDGDTTALCEHFSRVAKASQPNVRTLAMTNRNLTKFSSMSCVDECDLAEMNNALVHCKIAAPVDACVFYAAIFDNSYVSMAIMPADTLLPDVCLSSDAGKQGK